jgi:pimeloyl-ACP methyl ester carboxylesterase
MSAIKPKRYQRRLRRLIFTAAALVFMGLYFYCLYILHNTSTRRFEFFERTPAQLGLEAETVTLINSENIILKAWWIPSSESSSSGSVILLHGKEDSDASRMLEHAKFLHEAGYGVLTLDMRAHGRSGGTRIGWAIEEPLDVNAALDWMKDKSGGDQPIVIVGKSLGGATAIRTAAQRPEIEAVISIGSFASMDRQFRVILSETTKISKKIMFLFIPFMHLSTKTLFGSWPRAASPLKDIKKILPRPILMIHHTADSQVPVEHAYLLAKEANGKAQLWILDEDRSISLEELYREKILKFLNENLKTSIKR